MDIEKTINDIREYAELLDKYSLLEKENENLKEDLHKARHLTELRREENKELKKEIEGWKLFRKKFDSCLKDYKELVKDYMKLEEENKKLKAQIEKMSGIGLVSAAPMVIKDGPITYTKDKDGVWHKEGELPITLC